ncbi:MAG: transcription-repair coupling factor [Anaerolineaceae bacterium]|nr:MAG: transcription-repair coupling factor [Anaerolineaceae bacterium]
MNLSPLLTYIHELAEYKRLCQLLNEDESIPHQVRIPRSVRPPLAVALARDLQRPVVLIVPRADRMIALTEEIPAWDPDLTLLTFPDPNPLFYERGAWSHRTIRRRVTALASLTADRLLGGPSTNSFDQPTIILAPAKAIMTRTIPPQTFISKSRWLKVGGPIRFDQLVTLLINIGYTHTSLVTEPGQFSRRGGILDLWPPTEGKPVRLEFFGDELESMRLFNPNSQRSIDTLKEIRLTPAREGLPYLYQEAWDDLLPPGDPITGPDPDPLLEFFLPMMNEVPTGLLDYLPADSIILLDDRTVFEDAVNELEDGALIQRQDQIEAGVIPKSFPLPYLTLAEINDTLENRLAIDLGMALTSEVDDIQLTDSFTPGPRFGGQLRPLIDHLIDRILHHETIVIVSRQAPRLSELWSEADKPRPAIEALPTSLVPGDLHFIHGALSEGWILDVPDGERIHLLTDAEIFGWVRPRPRPRRRRIAEAPETAYADLKTGDWVVHVDYGIGHFAGLVERTLEGLRREYLLIEFGGGDQLYVPIHQADRITRYVGADGSDPTPSRLGTQEWDRAKLATGKAVEEIARELLDLYARRQTIQGYAFSSDTPWQGELESSFPYEETDDQLLALEEVKRDMEFSRPMDRLICGDVGYGKTEVALRAAFKSVMDGKQVGMLVPTTVLAQQHFNTFRQRLAAFPVEVEMLSRFRKGREVTQILQRLKSGEIDIVIGTHRLLQSDVQFSDLGLLIIDEEQRFGVTHKEHLKQLRTEVDVITLTATPIPRTLFMALAGARDISTINTPPEARLPVLTHVGPYDPRLIRQAVLRELDRGGQVYFVHNRVQTIETIKTRLSRLIPEALIIVAHGQMPEKELSVTMERFANGEIDVLVCTSIIESGLDIPNANTLIVDRADRFGLAQLYQLRGRVGRGATQAYAYFFRHPRYRATEEALYRLETIAEHSQLGAGYAIAMRDLEIRGAGDILGTRQHGHISAVGFHLYTRLLARAVRRLKDEYKLDAPEPPSFPHLVELLPVTIELPLPSAIPSDYIPERELRLQLYRRMAEVRSLEGIGALAEELIDRFGPLPIEVENLLYQLRVRLHAVAAGVESISMENGQLLLHLPREKIDLNVLNLGDDLRLSKRGLWLARSGSQEWTSRLVEVLISLASAKE